MLENLLQILGLSGFSLKGFGPLLLQGSWMTVKLSFLCLLVSVGLGLIGASAKLSKSALLRVPAQAYTTLIRGVPDLVLMLLIFYSLQTWLTSFTDFMEWEYIEINPFSAGVITLGFIYGAYFTETFRGAILAVPRGQMEAATAYGLTRAQRFRLVVFPQMMRFALPGISNNWMVILKATALVSIIGLADLVKVAQDAGKSSYQLFFFLILAALIYLVITTVSNYVLRRMEIFYAAGTRGGRAMIELLQEYWKPFLFQDGNHITGLAMTLWLLSASIFFGFVMSIPLSIARVSDNVWVRWPVQFYTYLFRGTPLYIQLLICYTGIYSLAAVRAQPVLDAFFRDAMNCTILAFALNTCAYTTEIFAGAIRSMNHGEVEAAKAYGLTGWKLYTYVIMPSALRRSLPYYSNEVILMLHSTTVAFTATIPDILKVARDANSATFLTFQSFGIAALIYLAVTFALVGLFRLAERRWLSFLGPAH